MNKQHVQTAVWLDKTSDILRGIRDEANHLSQFKYESGDISSVIYSNIRGIINNAINEINEQFEKL